MFSRGDIVEYIGECKDIPKNLTVKEFHEKEYGRHAYATFVEVDYPINATFLRQSNTGEDYETHT